MDKICAGMSCGAANAKDETIHIIIKDAISFTTSLHIISNDIEGKLYNQDADVDSSSTMYSENPDEESDQSIMSTLIFLRSSLNDLGNQLSRINNSL